jgi:hypothetical protein
MVPRGGPTHPPGIAERWHRNLPSLAKERNPVDAPRVSVAEGSRHAARRSCTHAHTQQLVERRRMPPGLNLGGGRSHATRAAGISARYGTSYIQEASLKIYARGIN